MVMLALDTSTSRTDVALVDDTDVLAHRQADGAMSHGEVLAGLVAQCLADAGITASGLSAIAVGTGPGPFTGLRVGLAFARTMALARGIAVYGICSLDVIAAAVAGGPEFVVATDARRKEIYWARYRDGERIEGPHVSKPADVADQWREVPIVGEGARTYVDLFPNAGSPLLPNAVDLAHLVQAAVAAGKAMPIDAQYLRAPDVTL